MGRGVGEEDGGKKRHPACDEELINLYNYSVKLSLSWFQLHVGLYGFSIFPLYNNIEHLPVWQKR